MSCCSFEHIPVTDPLFSCPPDLQKMGVTAALGPQGLHLWGCRMLAQHPALTRGTPFLVQNPKTHVAALTSRVPYLSLSGFDVELDPKTIDR